MKQDIKDRIISNMCYTTRHDYGLLDPHEQYSIWTQMEQLVDNCVAPEFNDSSLNVFTKTYDGESIYDAGRDFSEAFDESFNPVVATIPQDEYGLQLGTFTVSIKWEQE